MAALSPALRPPSRARKALTVAVFCVTLVLAVLLALLVLARFAGGWGIPYFPMTTAHGSRCTNTWTGFQCPSLTVADVAYFGDVELPPDARVVSSHYVSAHNYQLQASLEVPPGSSGAALAALHDAYGKCVKDHPSPLTEPRLGSLCVMADDQQSTETGVPDNRVFVVGTAVREDKTRVVNLSVRSR